MTSNIIKKNLFDYLFR